MLELRNARPAPAHFSCRTARSPAILWTIGALIVLETAAHCRVGKRLVASFERSAVKEVLIPTWRDLGGGPPRAFNATKPAAPNVLIAFAAPQKVRGPGGIERSIDRLALHLDAPEDFVALLSGNP